MALATANDRRFCRQSEIKPTRHRCLPTRRSLRDGLANMEDASPMPATDSLRRLGGGRWETRDGRFAIEPQSGTWVIVDNEQTDELGLPLVRGPFGSLTAAKDAIESARTEGPKASPLAERIEQARRAEKAAPAATRSSQETGRGPRREAPEPASASGSEAEPAKAEAAKPVAEPARPEPRWMRNLEPAGRRRARDLIARLERMGVDDPERIVRSEIADGQPALAQVAVERALAKALAASKGSPGALRAAVRAILRGADVELGVGWKLVDDDGRRIEKVNIPDD
jgi:hypothetical protein